MTHMLTRRELVTRALASPLLATAKSKPRPNVLLICTDQQRYDTVAALGNKHIDTPNLDFLVQQGVTFTHATTSCPVCAPARWGIQTGQWTTTHRCYSNHHPGTPPPEHTAGMLRRAGYQTALVGKNHTYLRPGDFDVFEYPRRASNAEGWSERERWMKDARQKYRRLFEEAVPGGPEADPMRAVTNRSLEFIDSAREKPFFLFTSYLHPHTPYYAMVSQIDAEIGILLKHLRDRGLEENTLVVMTSDHGDYMGDHGLCTKSPAMYDCLVRVPLILRWPGVIAENRMMILAGVDLEEGQSNAHIIRSEDGRTALWVGVIDDLWKFGRAVGRGGPWKDTRVKADEPSDSYLMTGYDRKSVTLSHQSSEPVTIHVEVDISGTGQWGRYESFEVPSGQPVNHKFPDAFQAYWVRVVASGDAVATAQFDYA